MLHQNHPNLSTLPEIAMPPLINGYVIAGALSQNNAADFADPFVGMRSSLPSDDTSSVSSS